MLVIKTDYLTDDMYDALTDLVLDVNEADGAKYAVPDDADYYAIAYEDGSSTVTVPEDVDAEKLDPDMMRSVIAIYEMGETHEGMTVIELSAFTGPAFRQRGWFWRIFRVNEISLRPCQVYRKFSRRFITAASRVAGR